MRDELRPDCARCFGLCCVALRFTASTDFAIDKDAGEPCPNLRADFGCGIHDSLRERGFPGCAVYDCFGAGQQVSQVTFGGTDWRSGSAESGERAQQMFDVLPVMRQLHELLWYLTEALDLPAAVPVHASLRRELDRTVALTSAAPDELLAFDVAAHRAEVNALLLRASELARGHLPQRRDHRGADLVGAVLQGADLSGACLRGAYLIAADLTDADLRLADLTGADMRDADLSGADLSDVLFLTQTQVNAARGDAGTKLPDSVDRPPHWPTSRTTRRRRKSRQ